MIDFQAIQTLLIAVSVIIAVVGVVGIIFIRVFAPQLANQVPVGVVEKLIEFNKTLLQAGLAGAATTPEEWDDQFYIAGLRLLGWNVTGSAETGYTLVPPTEE